MLIDKNAFQYDAYYLLQWPPPDVSSAEGPRSDVLGLVSIEPGLGAPVQ